MFAWSYIGQYIRHLFLAKSRHGTHSPFVYQLLEEVVYARKPFLKGGTKAERLAIALMGERHPGSVLLIGEFSPSFVSAVSEQHPGAACLHVPAGSLPKDTVYDLVVCQGAYAYEGKGLRLVDLSKLVHGQSVVILSPLYRHRHARDLWREWMAWEQATVTIDMFHTGLVFFHQGQAKEHFMIRYW